MTEQWPDSPENYGAQSSEPEDFWLTADPSGAFLDFFMTGAKVQRPEQTALDKAAELDTPEEN